MVNLMSMHSYIVTNLWAQCGCYLVPPPFYNKSRDIPTPSPLSVLTADDPPVLFSPHIHLHVDVNMHKKCASLPPPAEYIHHRCLYLSPTPPPPPPQKK